MEEQQLESEMPIENWAFVTTTKRNYKRLWTLSLKGCKFCYNSKFYDTISLKERLLLFIDEFCSEECSEKWHQYNMKKWGHYITFKIPKKPEIKICDYCQKSFSRDINDNYQTDWNWSRQKYCNIKCRNEHNLKINYSKWKKENQNYQKEYYLKNKQKIKGYYTKNKKKAINYGKIYYKENKDKFLAYQKDYRKNNKEYFREYQKRYIINNREKVNKYNAEYQKKRNIQLRKKLGLSKFKAKSEEILYSMLRVMLKGVHIRRHDRKQIIIGKTKLELDIFLPEYKVGIEYNGKHHYSIKDYKQLIKAHLGKEIDKYILEELFNKKVYYDRIKKKVCKLRGIKLIYFTYKDVLSFKLVEQRLRTLNIGLINRTIDWTREYWED